MVRVAERSGAAFQDIMAKGFIHHDISSSRNDI